MNSKKHQIFAKAKNIKYLPNLGTKRAFQNAFSWLAENKILPDFFTNRYVVYQPLLSLTFSSCSQVSAHYHDVIMDAIASQIPSLTIAYSTVYSDADERQHQSSTSLAFVRGIHRWLVNAPHKWPATWKMFPFDDVIMTHLKMRLL